MAVDILLGSRLGGVLGMLSLLSLTFLAFFWLRVGGGPKVIGWKIEGFGEEGMTDDPESLAASLMQQLLQSHFDESKHVSLAPTRMSMTNLKV